MTEKEHKLARNREFECAACGETWPCPAARPVLEFKGTKRADLQMSIRERVFGVLDQEFVGAQTGLSHRISHARLRRLADAIVHELADVIEEELDK